MTHVPVLTADVLRSLRPERGGLFVDCTVGLGGHASAILAAGATGLIGLDRDVDALERARETLAPWQDRVELIHADYRSLPALLDQRHIPLIDGALAQLECRTVSRHVEGDHTILVGRVEDARTGPGEPLLYYRGKYGRLASSPSGPT